MNVRFLKSARREMEGAIQYYDRQRFGLGQELAAELDKTLARIAADPTSYEQIEPGVFRLSTRRFPYAVIYVVRSDGVLVVAVQHGKRRPGYWKRRLRRT